jgi:hypothetical protein
MEMKRYMALAALLAAASPALAADEPARWSKPWDIETESDVSRDRVDAPWNHFLLDGQQGFISGREFYQAAGDVTPFLWPSHPFLRYGTDRGWQSDTNALEVRIRTGNEIGDAQLQELPPGSKAGDNRTPLTTGDVSWAPLEELRLHAGLDQNDHASYHTFPFRTGLAGSAKRDELAWFGGNLPPKSQATLGGSFEHRGSTMAAQFNQGWWWTNSPASGFAYPWEGFNADFAYKPGEDFELSLIEQRWDSPLDRKFYRAHWRRSELAMGFTGSSAGGWVWRLDLGFQRRELQSDSLFRSFLEQTYPTRFRYRQVWNAPDSIPLQLVSSGSMGFRERMIHVQHTSEFREKWGPHQTRQILKAYWRHPMDGYRAPTEFFAAPFNDSGATAETHPGKQARGLSGELEYRQKRKAFEAGLSGTYALEWETPLFRLDGLDTLYGVWIRRGAYEGNPHMLQNAAGRVFAGGNLGATGFWRGQAGLRHFWGGNADSMEFRPSRYWVGGGAGYAFPSDLRLEANLHWMGDKEVRGWGPVFTVPAHLENNLTLEQSLLRDRLKLSLSALHAFGEDIREQPNGNPLRFRILIGISGTIY